MQQALNVVIFYSIIGRLLPVLSSASGGVGAISTVALPLDPAGGHLSSIPLDTDPFPPPPEPSNPPTPL